MSDEASNTEPLRRLIQTVRDQTGWSHRRMAERTTGGMGHTRVWTLATALHKESPLNRAEVDALAAGLGVRWQVVQDADLRGHDLLDVQADDLSPEWTVLARDAADLAPAERDVVIRTARELVATFRAARQGSAGAARS